MYVVYRDLYMFDIQFWNLFTPDFSQGFSFVHPRLMPGYLRGQESWLCADGALLWSLWMIETFWMEDLSLCWIDMIEFRITYYIWLHLITSYYILLHLITSYYILLPINNLIKVLIIICLSHLWSTLIVFLSKLYPEWLVTNNLVTNRMLMASQYCGLHMVSPICIKCAYIHCTYMLWLLIYPPLIFWGNLHETPNIFHQISIQTRPAH